jgi:TetR/AcrR family transcriptional repressor of bet genes
MAEVLMPKQVDHAARRREIAEAVFRLIGREGYEAVSVRDVATEAGVSAGAVQHYFSSKDQMLLFALGYMRERVLARLDRADVAGSPRDQTRAAIRAMLPVDEPSRQEALVNNAFFALATVKPDFADLLREGYQRLERVSVERLRQAKAQAAVRRGIDVEQEAATLFYLGQGLIGPLLIGALTDDEAMALLDHHLDRIFS